LEALNPLARGRPEGERFKPRKAKSKEKIRMAEVAMVDIDKVKP
jgi:hypothetical protein